MKDIKLSPAAEATLAEFLEHSIDRWGLVRAEQYKDQLLNRVRSVARGELPHSRPCDVLMQGKRDAAGLCYCHEGSHFIILRETATRIEVVELIHQSRDLERLIDRLASAAGNKAIPGIARAGAAVGVLSCPKNRPGGAPGLCYHWAARIGLARGAL